MFDAPTMNKMMLQSKLNQGSEFIFEMQLMFMKNPCAFLQERPWFRPHLWILPI